MSSGSATRGIAYLPQKKKKKKKKKKKNISGPFVPKILKNVLRLNQIWRFQHQKWQKYH